MDIFELREAVASNPSPVECWCVMDYEEDWIEVYKGRIWPSGEMSGTEYIVPSKGFDQNHRFFSLYENIQLSECPWLVTL